MRVRIEYLLLVVIVGGLVYLGATAVAEGISSAFNRTAERLEAPHA